MSPLAITFMTSVLLSLVSFAIGRLGFFRNMNHRGGVLTVGDVFDTFFLLVFIASALTAAGLLLYGTATTLFPA